MDNRGDPVVSLNLATPRDDPPFLVSVLHLFSTGDIIDVKNKPYGWDG